MEQIVGGIQPGEEAQVQQAKVVQRIQANLERLAALGQLAHVVLPQSVHEVSNPVVSEAIPVQSIIPMLKKRTRFCVQNISSAGQRLAMRCLPVQLISG